MWSNLAVLFYLFITSIFDLRKNAVPQGCLMTGIVIALVMAGYNVNRDIVAWWECTAGVVPGLFLLLMAWATRKIGYADGWIMIIIGLVSGYQKCMTVLMISLLLSSVLSIFLLLLRRVNRDTKFPFVPVIALSFLLFHLL